MPTVSSVWRSWLSTSSYLLLMKLTLTPRHPSLWLFAIHLHELVPWPISSASLALWESHFPGLLSSLFVPAISFVSDYNYVSLYRVPRKTSGKFRNKFISLSWFLHKLNNHRRCSKCLPEYRTQICKRNNQKRRQ